MQTVVTGRATSGNGSNTSVKATTPKKTKKWPLKIEQ